MDLQMLLRIIQQTRTDAHLVVMAFEDVEMPAAFAAFPELRIVRELGVGDRTETEFIVHLHHGRAGGDGEDLGVREELAGQDESLLLDALGDAHAAELVRDDETGVGDETLAAPGFDVGESGEFAFVRHGDHGLAGADFLIDVLRRTLGDTGLALQRRDVDFVTDFLCKAGVALVGHHDVDVHFYTIKPLMARQTEIVNCNY